MSGLNYTLKRYKFLNDMRYEQLSNRSQGLRYVAILIWGLIYSIISILFGIMMTRLFNMPAWVTPAITFNNTTSLPLLLVQALDATNLLDSIDSTGDAVSRAESYFLVNAMVCNSLTFALGPKLLNGFEEDAPESKAEDDENLTEAQEQEVESANESTSLLPNHLVRTSTRAGYAAYRKGLRWWEHLPQWTRKTLDIFYGFVNPPVIGAVLGATVGLVPALHRLFFNSQENGGYLNAWLTSALQNIGDLFAALQVVVVGVKLSKSLLRMKKGEPNGELSVGSFMLVNITRFLIWPAFSIPVIYLLATKTQLLGNDPILWFSMMLMPAGPSAMLLVALTDVHGAGEDEKMTVAKFLTVCTALSDAEQGS